MRLSDLAYKLQPLRIPPGWCVDYNIFFEVDPAPETVDWLMGSCLYGASNQQAKAALELRYEPEGDPNGTFVLDLYSKKGRKSDSDLLRRLTSRSRTEIVTEIERYMDELSV